jgi:hypothetical protein
LVTDSGSGQSNQSYSARDTKGQSVADFFKGLLAARPAGNSGQIAPPRSSPAGGGAPASPAPDPASLGSVLGEERVPDSSPVPASDQSNEATVSFDDFFGSSVEGGSRSPGSPGKDDLDQFQTWLQNLKR